MRFNKHVSLPLQPRPVAHSPRPQLLTIMSSSIDYLTSRTNFLQVSQEIPITKSRNAEKYDQPDVFAG